MHLHRFPLDRSTADRLAGGDLHPSDAPPGYERVAELLFEAGQPTVVDTGSVVDERLLGDLVLAIATTPTDPRSPSMPSTRVSAKVAAVVAAAVLSVTGVAAAATGSLPGPAQDAVSGVVGAVGVDLPTADGDVDDVVETDPVTDPSVPVTDDLDDGTDEGDEATDDGTDDGTGDGADDGTGDGTGDGAAPRGPGEAHAANPTDADDHGAAVSDTARSTELSGREKGAAVSEVARAGHGRPGGGPGTTTTVASTTADEAEVGASAEPSSRRPAFVPGPSSSRGRG